MSTANVLPSIAWNLRYGAFGDITSITDANGVTPAVNPVRYTYTGREWDADADLYYYRARWYDAKAGRFISEDPKGFAAGDANLNRYVKNSSPNAVDPSGLDENPDRQKLFREIIERMERDRRYTAVDMQKALTLLYKSAYTTPRPNAQKAIDSSSSESLVEQYWFIITLNSLDYNEKFARNQDAFLHYQLDRDSGYSRLLGRSMPEWAQHADMQQSKFYAESREQLSKDVDTLLSTLDLVTFVGGLAAQKSARMLVASAERAEAKAARHAASDARFIEIATSERRAASLRASTTQTRVEPRTGTVAAAKEPVKFNPIDVDPFLDATIAEVPLEKRLFLIGETQPRLRFAASKLGHTQALEFWPENMKFLDYTPELHQQASIDFNKHLIRKLDQNGFKFFDLGADPARKVPGSSVWYKAELQLLQELGVSPSKVKPKFEIPKFKSQE